MQDTYTNFKQRSTIEDLPNEQYFLDNKIEFINTKNIEYNGKTISIVSDTYNTNIMSFVILTTYKYIHVIKKVDCVVNGTYNTFNIVVVGIKHTVLKESDNISIGEMSTLCLENSESINKVMEKYFGKG